MLDLPQLSLVWVLVGQKVHHLRELVLDARVFAFRRYNCADDLLGGLLAEIDRVAIAGRSQQPCTLEILAGDAKQVGDQQLNAHRSRRHDAPPRTPWCSECSDLR